MSQCVAETKVPSRLTVTILGTARRKSSGVGRGAVKVCDMGCIPIGAVELKIKFKTSGIRLQTRLDTWPYFVREALEPYIRFERMSKGKPSN